MMKKKLFAMALAMAMTLSLAACGGDNPDSSKPDNAGDDSAVFKIGTIGPLTGENAIYGQAVANGAKLAVDEINASGSAVTFALQSEDDVADGETSVNAYNNLMDWGMQALVGPTTSGASITVAEKCFAERTFMLTPSGSAPDIVKDRDNVFQVCFSDPNQGVSAADYMAQNMPDAKLAVIYRNDDAYSQGVRDTFAAESANKGLEIVYEGTFTADTSTDFSVQLTAAQAAGADTVFLPIYYQPASVILKQADAMNYAPAFFGMDGMDGILTMKGFDTSLAEGLMLLTPFSADAGDERTQNFVKTYQERFGDVPNQFAADAYDAVYVVKAALEAAGCTADMAPEDICEAVVGVMTTISVDGLTGQGMTWTATGEVSKAPRAVMIKDGAYVVPTDK